MSKYITDISDIEKKIQLFLKLLVAKGKNAEKFQDFKGMLCLNMNDLNNVNVNA